MSGAEQPQPELSQVVRGDFHGQYTRRRQCAAEPAPLPGITCSRSLKMLGVDIGSDFCISQHVQRLVTTSAQTIYALRVLRSCGLSNAALQPPSSHGWRMPPAHGAVSPRRLINSALTRWLPTTTDTARRIYRRLTNCATLQTTNFSARQCVCRTTFYMHYCRHRRLHHNVTVCENAHIHCSYLNILLTCQTVIS